MKRIRACDQCMEIRPTAGRGLCGGCYSRWRKSSRFGLTGQEPAEAWRLTQEPSGKTGPRAPAQFAWRWPVEAYRDRLHPRLEDLRFLLSLLDRVPGEVGMVGEPLHRHPTYCPLCGHADIRHSYVVHPWMDDRGWTCLAGDEELCSCSFGIRSGEFYSSNVQPSFPIPKSLQWTPRAPRSGPGVVE